MFRSCGVQGYSMVYFFGRRCNIVDLMAILLVFILILRCVTLSILIIEIIIKLLRPWMLMRR